MDLLKQKPSMEDDGLSGEIYLVQIKQWIYYSKLQKKSRLEPLHQLFMQII